jgi:hypothetical protein
LSNEVNQRNQALVDVGQFKMPRAERSGLHPLATYSCQRVPGIAGAKADVGVRSSTSGWVGRLQLCSSAEPVKYQDCHLTVE